MPVSSFTWTRPPPASATARSWSSRQITTSAPAASAAPARRRPARPSPGSAPRRARPHAARPPRGPRPPRASSAPPASAARALRSAPWPYPSALTTAHSAAPPRSSRRMRTQLRSSAARFTLASARPGAPTPASLRPAWRVSHVTHRRRHSARRGPADRAGSASITSPATTPSAAPTRRAARRPACRCRSTAPAAAVKASRPPASSAATTPVRTSPVPAVASPGARPGLTATSPSGARHQRVVALQHHHRTRLGGRRTHVVQAPGSISLAVALRAGGRARRRGVSAPSERARAASSARRPAWAFEPVGVDHHRQLGLAGQAAGEGHGGVAAPEAGTERQRPSTLGRLEHRLAGPPRCPRLRRVLLQGLSSSAPARRRRPRPAASRRARRRSRSRPRRACSPRAAIVGAPVSPREPPAISTCPELNLVDPAPRRGSSASSASVISPSAGRPEPRGGCRCRPPRPYRRGPCPG